MTVILTENSNVVQTPCTLDLKMASLGSHVILNEHDVYQKLDRVLKLYPEDLLAHKESVPLLPGRNVTVLPMRMHPPKAGLSKPEGKARLMHDLASIELQAMELGLRTLLEFPESDVQFREDLAKIVISEAQHLKLCFDEIERLGYRFGHWPVHVALWEATAPQDSLLDRILIVHRYLEGSGLDAGDTLLRRIQGLAPEMQNLGMLRAVKTISEEEVGHVKFGSDYYRYFCRKEALDPNADFAERLQKLSAILPRRLEPMNKELRFKAGFDAQELIELERLQKNQYIK